VHTKKARQMSKTVMIVEDNDLNMIVFEAFLQSQGYQTVQVADGREVLNEVCRTNPDLILLDIRLPGLSGFEVVSILKSHLVLNSIPVIALTAYAMPGEKQRILESGFDGYLSKPVAMQELLKTVEHHLTVLNSFPMSAANLKATRRLAA
tara:strand:- start:2442 stop:2891 length:450 start_codon:yes stop_codon:yes gene_type:complete